MFGLYVDEPDFFGEYDCFVGVFADRHVFLLDMFTSKNLARFPRNGIEDVDVCTKVDDGFYLFFINGPVFGDIEDDIVCGFNEATVVAVDFILYIGIDGVSFATVFLL